MKHPGVDQNQTPLLNALQACINHQHAAFYTPGHKRGAGIPSVLQNLLGEKLFKADLSELSELDNLAAPNGAIADAQVLAAQAFGAETTYFLVNGSTCGIVAAILATCNPGDKIILPRNIHTSVISGVILADAVPIFIQPEYDPLLDLTYSIDPAKLAITLNQHPDAKAVMIVYPTYEGVCGDITTIAKLTHAYHIPLLVDEAHGSHFGFHPQLPISALAAGADLSVQSIHKTLGAMTQASMLHINSNLINLNRLNKALRIVQSSSPSYILMAALDAARYQMATTGINLMSSTLELVGFARTQISQISGLSLLDYPPRDSIHTKIPGFFNLDPTRLTVNVSKLGISGFTADEILETDFAVRCELSSLQHLTFLLTFGNTQADIHQLITGLKALTQVKLDQYASLDNFSNIRELNHKLSNKLSNNWHQINSQPKYTPRQAFFANHQTVAFATSCGQICAETICPYPPGIPILLPGELITPTALEYLQTIKNMGGLITGCADTNLQTLQVIV